MSAGSLAPPIESFPLRGGRRPLTLHATGLRHTASWLSGGEGFTGFEEITDLGFERRGLRIGTLRNVLLLPRRLFLDPDAPERLAAGLIDRIGRTPEGSLQLARMAELEQAARRPAPLRVTAVTIAICLLVYLLELVLGPDFQFAGHFSTALFQAGESWRLLTANFLHAGPVHLLVNLVGLRLVGAFVERPLGAGRTLLVLAASAVGGMGAAAAIGQEGVLGASGMVCGLAGAVCTLEFRLPERIPAVWRVPRRLLLVAIGLEALASILIPIVAGAAHLGGFLAGAAAARLATPRSVMAVAAPAWLKAAVAGILLAVLAAGTALVRETTGGAAVLARRAERLLTVPGISPVLLNNAAWMIATAPAPSPSEIEVALRSAERAVAQSDRSDPNFLDTLAETQFLAGLSEEAIDTIDEAIALAPEESYFVEQRRRFTGERAYDDRPAPPSEPALRDEPLEPWPREPSPRHPGLPPGHPPIGEDPGISV